MPEWSTDEFNTCSCDGLKRMFFETNCMLVLNFSSAVLLHYVLTNNWNPCMSSILSFLSALSFCPDATLRSHFHTPSPSPLHLSVRPLSPLCVLGGPAPDAGLRLRCHSGLLCAVMGGRAGQPTAAATHPLCWWWYLRVISPGTLCRLHREAEN